MNDSPSKKQKSKFSSIPIRTLSKILEKTVLLFLVYGLSAVLLITLVFLYTINTLNEQEIQQLRLRPLAFVLPLPSSYPSREFAKEATSIDLPTVSASGFVVMDVSSSTVLYTKNPTLRFSLASTTKIMTALTALSYFQPDDVLVTQTTGIEGARLGLAKGEKLYFQDALYGLLLPSGNDVAVLIAENYPGGKDAFVAKMNENAKRWHLQNTHFGDPTGLNDRENYTTPVDLARLASIAIKNHELMTIVNTKQKAFHNVDKTKTYTVYNLNRLLGVSGVRGIKTGTTEEAGQVLVTLQDLKRQEQTHPIIYVVMRSTDRFSDTLQLMQLVANTVTFLTFSY